MRWFIFVACLVFGGCNLPPDFWTRPIYVGAGQLKNGCHWVKGHNKRGKRMGVCIHRRPLERPGTQWVSYPPAESYVSKPSRSSRSRPAPKKRHRQRRHRRHR